MIGERIEGGQLIYGHDMPVDSEDKKFKTLVMEQPDIKIQSTLETTREKKFKTQTDEKVMKPTPWTDKA